MTADDTASDFAPGLDRIEAIARDALDRLPDAFRAHLGDVVLIVEDFADDATLDAMGMESPFELTGLYHGRPMGEKDGGAVPEGPDRIHLYRRPILDEWCETGVGFDALVRHVLIHEVGHHFGLSDADMHALEDAVGDDEAGPG